MPSGVGASGVEPRAWASSWGHDVLLEDRAGCGRQERGLRTRRVRRTLCCRDAALS